MRLQFKRDCWTFEGKGRLRGLFKYPHRREYDADLNGATNSAKKFGRSLGIYALRRDCL